MSPSLSLPAKILATPFRFVASHTPSVSAPGPVRAVGGWIKSMAFSALLTVTISLVLTPVAFAVFADLGPGGKFAAILLVLAYINSIVDRFRWIFEIDEEDMEAALPEAKSI